MGTKIRGSQISAATSNDGITDLHIKSDAAISQSKISGLPGALSTLQSEIDAEATARTGALTDLNTSLSGAISAEVTSRTNADETLQNNIDTEATARQNAVSTLQNNIDAEATARENAVTALTDLVGGGVAAEATARQAADDTLQSNIDAEATSRINAVSTLQSNLNTEVTARQNAVGTLQANLDAEVTARQGAIADVTGMVVAIGTNTEWQASCDNYAVAPPSNPTLGYRVLIVASINTVTSQITTGVATGDFAGHENEIATCTSTDPVTWDFTVCKNGTFTSVDTVPDGICAFVGSWSLKHFEATTNGDGLSQSGLMLSVNVVSGGGVMIDATTKGVKVDPTVVLTKTQFIVRDSYTGALDGVNTVFTTSVPLVPNSEMVFLNGMFQKPNEDYTISEQNITFTNAPEATDDLVINFNAA